MARDILKVQIQLDHIKCHDEGDGWGSAEPYLWPVFFKLDGDSVMLDASLMLTGTATVQGTFGNHGNLNNDDVDAGEDVPIPEGLGTWETSLKPIPVDPSLKAFVDDVAGVAGVAVILMEEDNVSDHGAIAGYNALVAAIQSGLDGLIPTLGVANQNVSDADLDKIRKAAESAVKKAIEDSQNFLDNLWSAINPDDQIGSLVAQFGHDTLADLQVHPIHERWKNEGDWEFFGHANASVLCPASAIDGLKKAFGSIFGESDMKMMRRFRDDTLPKYQGARAWWGVAERNAAALLYVLLTDKNAARAMASLGPMAARILGDPKAAIPADLIGHARTVLESAERSRSRSLRRDARRGLSLLALAEGRSVTQMLEIADAGRPGRKVDRKALDRLAKARQA